MKEFSIPEINAYITYDNGQFFYHDKVITIAMQPINLHEGDVVTVNYPGKGYWKIHPEHGVTYHNS